MSKVSKFLALLLLAVLPAAAFGQTTVIPKSPFEQAATFSSSTNSACWPVPLGVHYFTMRWENPLGTVTGGTVKLVGSMSATCSSPTDIIAPQTFTSFGTVNGTAGGYKYARLTSASYSGSGSVRVFVAGDKSVTNVTVGDITIENVVLGAGTANIGDVDVLSFPDNEPINLAQIGGNALSTTLPISGTVTANLSATDNAVLDLIESYTSRLLSSASAVAGGAGSATTALLAGGIYNSTPITLTNGQQAGIQFDANGYLKVSGISAGGLTDAELRATAVPISGTITANLSATDNAVLDDIADGIAVTNVGTFAVQAAGTKTNNNAAPGATNVGALVALANASAPTWSEGNLVALSVDTAGALRVSGSAGTTQYNQSTVATATDSLVMIGVRRVDADAALDADGDRTVIQVDETGYVKVSVQNVVVDSADNAAFPNTSTEPPVGVAGIYESSLPTYASGDKATLHMDVNGRAITAEGGALLTSSQLIDDTIFADEAAFTYATSKVITIGAVAEATSDLLADGTAGALSMTLRRTLRTTPTGYLTGGGVPISYVSTGATEDEHAVCAAQCTLYQITAMNHGAASAFLRCENDVIGSTVPGSETNLSGEPDIEIPGSTTGAGFVIPIPIGASYSTALTCWIVTGEAATDVAEVGANDVRIWYVIAE